MAKTRHIHRRMSQRGVTSRMLELVCDYGVQVDDKLVLDKKSIDQLLQRMDRMRSDMLKLRDKGGLVVVEVNGNQITVYNPDSYKRH